MHTLSNTWIHPTLIEKLTSLIPSEIEWHLKDVMDVDVVKIGLQYKQIVWFKLNCLEPSN